MNLPDDKRSIEGSNFLLPLDVWRSIVSISKIYEITNISSISKSFHSLCLEKCLWLNKFKYKNLEMINDNIITVNQYIEEYKKVSYASYIANCLFDLVQVEERQFKELYKSFYDICWIYPFDIKYLSKILEKDTFNLIKIKANDHNKVFVRLEIKSKGQIKYYSCEKYYEDFISDTYFGNHAILVDDYDCKNTLISLITKILYYIPSITITDAYQLCRIFRPIHIMDWNSGASSIKDTIVGSRIEYWDKCYSKYEEHYY